jgi:hypothetical protein
LINFWFGRKVYKQGFTSIYLKVWTKWELHTTILKIFSGNTYAQKDELSDLMDP